MSAFTEASHAGANVPPLTREQNQIEEVQTWFSDLKEDNLELTAQEIIASPFSKSRDLAPVLAQLFLQIIPVRPSDTQIFVKLCSILKQNETNGNSLSIFRQRMLQIAMTPYEEYEYHTYVPYLYFIRQLTKSRVVEVWDVVTRIQAIPAKKTTSKFLAACFFLPEISVSDEEYYQKLVAEFSNVVLAEPLVEKYRSRLEELTAHNFKILRELIEYGVEKSSVEYALLTDNLPFIQEYCKSPGHSVNELVPESPFTPWRFLQWSPTFTEFAAFYGSLKIVHWLLDNNSKRSFLTQFAVAGGRWPIIEHCTKQGIPYHCCLRIAAYYRRMDVFNYIVPKLESFRLRKEINYAMCRAAETNDIRMFRTCIEMGSLINFADENNETALFLATKGGYKPLVQYILSFKEVRKNVPNCWGKQPADVAPRELANCFK